MTAGHGNPAPAARAGAVSHLLYLHGFRSSPRSFKARMLAAWVQAQRSDLHWWCPQLPPSPREAVRLLLDGIEAWPQQRMAVIGSSLGGFYATLVAERSGCPAVLLNPAVNPQRDLAQYIGEQAMFHTPQDHFFFRPEFIDELRELTPPRLTRPERYFVIVAKGDEVLDWREMSARHAGARVKLLEAGDHALSDFADHLPDLISFLSLQPTSTP